MKAFSYLRFSSAKQADGDSIRRQTEATRRWCERNGVQLDETLTEQSFVHEMYRIEWCGGWERQYLSSIVQARQFAKEVLRYYVGPVTIYHIRSHYEHRPPSPPRNSRCSKTVVAYPLAAGVLERSTWRSGCPAAGPDRSFAWPLAMAKE